MGLTLSEGLRGINGYWGSPQCDEVERLSTVYRRQGWVIEISGLPVRLEVFLRLIQGPR